MLIRIHKSRLFDTNPAERFAEEYSVSQDLWMELWKRYKILGYSIPELADYFHLKSGRCIKRQYIKRWIFLTEVYTLTKVARDMGAEAVSTEIFGEYERRVIDEVTRHLKSGRTCDSRIMA